MEPSVELKVMTYNIRYGTAPDGQNSWMYRQASLLELIARHDPDILGVQEALAEQIEEIQAVLPTHHVIGAGRNDGISAGEHSALFYRRDKLGLREGGTRWLSESPDQPGSMSWGARHPRVFTWAEFFTQSLPRILVLNCHLDHESQDAQYRACQQMLQFIDDRPDIATLIMGDFNCGGDSLAVQLLTSNGKMTDLVPVTGPTGTFNGFDPTAVDDEMIDHILIRGNLIPAQIIIDRTTSDNRTLSDHFPLIADLTLKSS